MRYFLTLFIAVFFLSSSAYASEKVLNIQEITSKNGIKAWLVEDHSLPIIAVKFSFKGAGSVQDGKEKQGLARLLSNTMDEGAGDLTSQEFQKKLSDYSITLHFNSNRDNFSGQLKTLSKNKELAFHLLKISLNEPRFDSEPMDRMRDANISRIQSSKGNPDWINARIFNDLAFAGHPYAFNSGGTLTTLTNITAKDLKNFKNDWLTKDRLVIGVTGDIKKDELSNILDDVFGSLPATGKASDIEKYTLQNSGKNFLYKKEISQTLITSALPGIDRNDPDYYALQVMNYIYGGGGFGSRLMEEAREKRGLTYGIYSNIVSQDYINTFNISTSTKNESTSEMLKIIKEEMIDLRDNGVTEKELQDAKSYIIGSMPLSLTSTEKVANILLSLQLNERPIDYLDTYISKISSLTTQDIQNIARRLLIPDNLVTVMVGNIEKTQNTTIIEKIPNVE